MVGGCAEGCDVPDAAVDELCARLTKLLSADGEIDDGKGDGKDYVVELRDIRLGFGARMLLQKTDFILERDHRCAPACTSPKAANPNLVISLRNRPWQGSKEAFALPGLNGSGGSLERQ